MENLILVSENDLVDVVANLMVGTVGCMADEISSLEELAKGQEKEIEELLESKICLNEEVNQMSDYIAKLEKRVMEQEIKIFFYELFM